MRDLTTRENLLAEGLFAQARLKTSSIDVHLREPVRSRGGTTVAKRTHRSSMNQRSSLRWGANFFFFCAALIGAQLSSPQALAKEQCPFGTWLSGETCCEPGSEYVASKN
ncbi:MAG TPA: hypothetical protein VMF89_14135, partial [Polyangiales bacterium]|nr:hypothetical protein [Polyangiales bacterium]